MEGNSPSISSGNQNERLEIVAGRAVVIDHYMPACPSFRRTLEESGMEKALSEFGGVSASLPNGTYSVLRNPYEKQMLVTPVGSNLEDFKLAPEKFQSLGKVFVDTRCLLILDESVLSDKNMLDSYREFWIDGTEGQKKARDLIRTKGGAVRYGFSRGSDEINVGVDAERLALWCTPEDLS